MEYSKNLSNTLVLRKSCRSYVPNKPMKEADIDLITWAGERAAFCSGGPRREIITIVDQDKKNLIMEACMDQKYVGDCSTIFVLSGTHFEDKLRSGFAKFAPDCYMACCQMHLMATSLGFGSVIIGNFIPDIIKEIVGTDFMLVSFEHRPTIILLVGYKG